MCRSVRVDEVPAIARQELSRVVIHRIDQHWGRYLNALHQVEKKRAAFCLRQQQGEALDIREERFLANYSAIARSIEECYCQICKRVEVWIETVVPKEKVRLAKRYLAYHPTVAQGYANNIVAIDLPVSMA